MKPDFWVSQTKDSPLFADLLWSRPENKRHAGKLLIVGGNLHGFAAPAEAYAEAVQAGAGTVRALLPQAIQKIVGIIIENADFAPSTPGSGSFSQKALADVLSASAWADSVLVAGDLGRNAETAILLESFLGKSQTKVTLTRDAVDYATSAPHAVLHRPQTLLVLSLSQLQRLSIATRYEKPITFSMDLLHLVEWLHAYTKQYAPYIMVKHHDHLCVAVDGRVSTTKLPHETMVWRLRAATHAATWWMQHTNKVFEALTVSALTP